MTKPLQMLRWSLARRGFRGTLHAAGRSLLRRLRGRNNVSATSPWDTRWGLDTSGFLVGHQLGGEAANAPQITGYAATAPSSFAELLAIWQRAAGGPPVPLEQITFVDIGCGKGRAVMMASQWSFRAAVGLEIDAQLARTAEANLERWRQLGQARCPLSVEQGDALEASLPEGDLLLFLYNPFSREMLEKLVERLADRQQNRRAHLWLIYHNENEVTALESEARLECLWRGVLPVSEEDRAAELVIGHNDMTGIYRWRSS